MMNSLAHGNSTSTVEITHISTHGVWLLANNEELFLSYEDFPWFRNQVVKVIHNVVEQSPGHSYWPDIDLDLTGEMIKHPEKFPLEAKSS
jgi:hypothetical protein